MSWWAIPCFCLGLYGLSILFWYLAHGIRTIRDEVLLAQRREHRQIEMPRLIVDVDALDARGGNGRVHNEVIIKRR